MDFNVVLRRELGKGIAVGILDQKQFPTLTAALDGSNKNLDLAIKTKSRFFSLTMNNEEDDTPNESEHFCDGVNFAANKNNYRRLGCSTCI